MERPPSLPAWSRRDLALTVLVAYGLFVLVIVVFDSYPRRVRGTGDNYSYAAESAAVRGAAAPGTVAMHFVGYPLLAAPFAALLRIQDMDALPIVSIIGGLVAIALAGELWGAWVAAWFAVVNLDFIQRTLLGGADPVFAAFVFAALLAARRERWAAAAVLGALATVVRPLGIVVLVALGLVLLWRRRFAWFAAALAISGVIGGSYFALMRARFGQGAGNLLWYKSMGLGHDRTFIPFVTIFLQSPGHPLTGKNVAKTLVWMTFTFAALVAALARRATREAMREAPVEWLFGALYTASFLFFPAWWIEGEYPRYFSPVIPLCFVALRPCLPEKRWLVWPIGLASVLLAAVEDMPLFGRAMHGLLG